MSKPCVDKVVGKILAGWRYDISGIATEMRGDYEQHFKDCEHCRNRRILHRTIDIGLIAIATVSAGVFLLAFGATRYLHPRYSLLLELIALGGFGFSAVVWIAVAIATPAPVVMADAARLGARRLHDRLPEEIRDKLPDTLKLS